MAMKEQITEFLGGFLEQNKNYAVEVYVENGITDKNIARLFVSSNRKFEAKETKCIVQWESSETCKSEITFYYAEILDCYVGYLEPDMRNLFRKDIIIAMKNGMKYRFQCVGMPG